LFSRLYELVSDPKHPEKGMKAEGPTSGIVALKSEVTNYVAIPRGYLNKSTITP
jgi:hypothetical protein